MKDGLVSIITPMYNSEKYISATIDSVLKQTYKNWEMIIINDGSNDNSKEIVSSYVNLDGRIKVIDIKKNRGVSYARNKGISNSQGSFIAFIDSDDIWNSNKLEKQIEFMITNNAAWSFTAYELIDEENNPLKKIIEVPEFIDYNGLLKGNIIGCSTVMIDKRKIDKIEMPLNKHEDYITWLSILKRGYRGYGLNDVLTNYRKLDNSISSNKLKSAKWTWEIYREVEKLNLFKSLYYFSHYMIKGIMKHW